MGLKGLFASDPKKPNLYEIRSTLTSESAFRAEGEFTFPPAEAG
jgi:hypothetical protein